MVPSILSLLLLLMMAADKGSDSTAVNRFHQLYAVCVFGIRVCFQCTVVVMEEPLPLQILT